MIRRAALAACTSAAAFLAPAGYAAADEAIFAGGCFWCVESDFDKVPGVTETVSGYIGGSTDNPTYYDHTKAGHREAVRIEFDPAQVSYEQLLTAFFHSVDPTDGGGQFCDRGHSYTTAVFAVDAEQRELAEAAKAEAANELGQELATEIVDAPAFWPAEDFHQDYYKKNPLRYKYYRNGCGRDDRLAQVWGEAAMKGIPGS